MEKYLMARVKNPKGQFNPFIANPAFSSLANHSQDKKVFQRMELKKKMLI